MQSVTIEAAKNFADAMTDAGMPITFEEVLNQKLVIEQHEENGNKFEVATSQGYPLMIKKEGGEWDVTPLDKVADVYGISFGSQGLWEGLVDSRISTPYKAAFEGNFNQLVIDGELQWGGGDKAIRPGENTFDFKKADILSQFAEQNGMKIQGHHLIWGIYPTVPNWLLDGNYSQEALRALERDHILKVMAHYPNVTTWSVVNEPFPYGNGVDFWYDKLGQDYIHIAFETARSTDPNTLLMLNDTGNEVAGQRSDFGFKVLKGLVDEGYQNLGYGFQMHIDGMNPPNIEKMVTNMKRFTDMGVEVSITEMDVDMSNFQGTAEAKRQAQAKIYYDIIKAYVAVGGHDLSVFGVSDGVSWFKFTGKPDAEATILDIEYKPKLDYYAVMKAIIDGASLIK